MPQQAPSAAVHAQTIHYHHNYTTVLSTVVGLTPGRHDAGLNMAGGHVALSS
jgi:hypothetical protein